MFAELVDGLADFVYIHMCKWTRQRPTYDPWQAVKKLRDICCGTNHTTGLHSKPGPLQDDTLAFVLAKSVEMFNQCCTDYNSSTTTGFRRRISKCQDIREGAPDIGFSDEHAQTKRNNLIDDIVWKNNKFLTGEALTPLVEFVEGG